MVVLPNYSEVDVVEQNAYDVVSAAINMGAPISVADYENACELFSIAVVDIILSKMTMRGSELSAVGCALVVKDILEYVNQSLIRAEDAFASVIVILGFRVSLDDLSKYIFVYEKSIEDISLLLIRGVRSEMLDGILSESTVMWDEDFTFAPTPVELTASKI